MNTDTNLLLRWIVENNLTGIWARLLRENRVSTDAIPNAPAVAAVIEEQMERLIAADYLNWLEQLLDVPIVATSLYARELEQVRTSSMKSPAKYLTDALRAQLPAERQVSAREALWGSNAGGQLFTLVFWACALLGAFVVLRFVGRRLLGVGD